MKRPRTTSTTIIKIDLNREMKKDKFQFMSTYMNLWKRHTYKDNKETSGY
jgi:hypothetical protein